MQKWSRIFMVVTDSLGIGEDKRAIEFNNKGANTFYSVSKTGLLEIPTWKRLGIDSIALLEGYNKSKKQEAYTARVEELSNAKDTLAGHWEMMGIKTEIPFPVFEEKGFPQELLDELEKAFGKKIVGNKSASGTEILDELADEEIKNGKVIVYTSADSVMQICGHEETMGLKELYRMCEEARRICNSKPEWKVGRIIARPYTQVDGKWVRTPNRHDYAVKPPKKTILDFLQDKGIETIGVGKIFDIFEGQGISKSYKSSSDDDGMDITIDLAMEKTKDKFIFVNLVDFDSKYGHRRDPEGYAENINRFDIKLTKLINALKEDDLLIITSDHGNDPMWPGSDHTREHVPATIYSKSFKEKPKKLNNFIGFGTLGNIVAKNFGVALVDTGEDRFDEII